MNFVQVEFPIFFGVVLAVYWALGDVRRQNVWLLVCSAVFYGWVHPWFVVLLYAASTVDFSTTNLMVRYPGSRRALLAVSVVTNLTLLGFFKYFNFFVDNFASVADALGARIHPAELGILLPIGISFYTFQTLGYTIDVYRGELKPRSSFLDYIVYVSFFPQLVAGPIERAGRLLPQLERPRRFSWANLESGLGLALWGAFKKMVIADSISPYVDKIYALHDPAGPLIWAATAGFMLQIFADFSGYTDIARGVARMLGVELMENFRAPFLATSVAEFWQRWHISLSSWIRDYLLGPLVGDAGAGRARFAAATLLTFAIMGFWHGASWNFVLFGLWHGFWTVTEGLLSRRFAGVRRVPGWGAFAILFQLLVVGLVGTLLFREHSVARIVQHLAKNPLSASRDEWVATTVVLSMTLVGWSPLLAGFAWDRLAAPRLSASPWVFPLRTSMWAVYALAMWICYRVTAQDFVYFQF